MNFLKSSINLPAITDASMLDTDAIMQMSSGSGDKVPDEGQLSAMSSVKELFFDMRDSLKAIVATTQLTNELLKTMVMGDAAQDKKDSISAGDTDPDPKPKEKGPGILSRVMGGLKGAFSSLMPEKGGFMDTLLKLGLAGGGIALLKIFGDDMIPYLASLLKSIKEGKIGKYLREAYEYVKDIGIGAFEKIKEKTILLIDAFVKVKDFIVDTYNKINDFIMSFDVNEDGILDEEERRNLKLVIQEKISKFLFSTIGKVIKSIGSVFGLLTAASIMTRIGTMAGTGAGIGLLGTAALVAVAAAGIYKLYDNINFALKDSLDEETGDLKGKEFAAKLLAGKDAEGGVMNAANNALDKSLIGMVTGGVIGFLIGGPAGAILGARIGFASGGVIGAALGYLGSNLLTGTDPGDTAALSKELTEAKIGLAAEMTLQKKNPIYAESDVGKQALLDAQNLVNELTEDVDIAPSINKVQTSEKIEKKIKEITKNNIKMQKELDLFQKTNGDKGSVGVNMGIMSGDNSIIPYEKIIRENELKIQELSGKKIEVDESITSKDLIVTGNERQNSEFADSYFGKFGYTDADYLTDKIIADKLIKMGANMVRSENEMGYVFANNNNDISTKVANETNLLGSLSQDNRHFTPLILAYKQSKLQTG